MPRHEFEGRSAAEAAIKACEELGVRRTELRYDVLSETGEGMDRRVVIAVEAPEPGAAPAALEAPRGEGESRAREARGDREYGRDRGGRGGRDRDRDRGGREMRGGERGGRDRGGRDRGGRDRDRDRGRGPRMERGDRPDPGIEAMLKLDEVPEGAVSRPELTSGVSERGLQAKTVLNDVLRLMGFSASGRVVQDDAQEIHVDITGDDAKRVIGKMGEPLLSMQFLVNRMVSRENEGEQVVVLDVAGYRERRRAALAELARKLAQRALEEHKVVKLSPMSAHDRRVFHLTLTEVQGVTTQSEGEGLYRRLLIIPSEFTAQPG